MGKLEAGIGALAVAGGAFGAAWLIDKHTDLDIISNPEDDTTSINLNIDGISLSRDYFTENPDGTITYTPTPTIINTPTLEPSNTPTIIAIATETSIPTVTPDTSTGTQESLNDSSENSSSIVLDANGSFATDLDKTYLITGDIRVDQTPLHDNLAETGLMTIITDTEADVFAEWGASVIEIDRNSSNEEIINSLDSMFSQGCEDNKGCESITIKFIGGESDGSEVVVKKGEEFTGVSTASDQPSTETPTIVPTATEVIQDSEANVTMIDQAESTPTPTNQATEPSSTETPDDLSSELVPDDAIEQVEIVEPAIYEHIESNSIDNPQAITSLSVIIGDVYLKNSTDSDYSPSFDDNGNTGSITIIEEGADVNVYGEYGYDTFQVNDFSNQDFQNEVLATIENGCGSTCSEGATITVMKADGTINQINMTSEEFKTFLQENFS